MAAIIDFPKEASVWRRHRVSVDKSRIRPEGKLLLFTGIRYDKKMVRDKAAVAKPVTAEESKR